MPAHRSPSLRRPRPFVQSHALAVALALGCLGLGTGISRADTASETRQIEVGLSTVTQGQLSATETFAGRITPISSAVRLTSCAFEGQVVQLAVHAGTWVQPGTLLMTVRTSANTRQQVARAQASLAYAREHRAQTQALLKAHLATQADLTQAEQALALAEADWQALVARGATTPEHRLTAAHAGIVQQISVQLGGVFTANQPLLTSVDDGQLEASVPVPAALAAQLKTGDSVTIQAAFGALPPVTARITAIDPMVLPQSDRQPVHLSLPRTTAGAAPWVLGQAILAHFHPPGPSGLILPHSAIQTDAQGQTRVWRDQQQQAEAVPVRVLATAGSQSVVEPLQTGRLASGDRVVAVGAGNVAAGMRLVEAPPSQETRP
ncbi:efflux RND transporter periplasmic adaptor subunit [Halothiobacillus sp. DCM-1]|uniref:efflux RND transporter periplasmic adaptor subunit n=1 Tax=Halothiobacillus sp. DCM-1 TaxID=3112558 RepID=UPI0032549016